MSHLPYVGNSWPGWDPGFKGGVNVDSDEGPAACSPYPEGSSAASPGSRSTPRVHVGKGNNPGGVEESAAFAPLPGYGIQRDTLFPGCVLRTTRGYRLPSLRDARTPEAWGWFRHRLGQGNHQGR